MPVRDIAELKPGTADVVRSYLAALDEGFCAVSREIAEDVLADVEAQILNALEADSSPDAAREVTAGLGEPDSIAAELCAEVGTETRRTREKEEGTAEPMGRVLGMPFDASLPTPDKVRSRVWNPDDPRIFTPRLIGVGWTINFAALAVKTGIIRPDDEDEPFGAVPEGWLWGALLIPVGIAAATAFALITSIPNLPELLPIHWNIRGEVDGYGSVAVALYIPAGFSAAALAYVLWSYVTGRSKAARAVSSAFATLFIVLGAWIVAAVLYSNAGVELGWWWPWVMILMSMGIPFVMLTVLSRVGSAHEIKHDLGR